MSQQLAYENRVEDLQKELMQSTRVKQEVESEYSTLKKTVQNKEKEEKKRQSMLEVRKFFDFEIFVICLANKLTQNDKHTHLVLFHWSHQLHHA